MKGELCPVCGGIPAKAGAGLLACGGCGLAFTVEKYFGLPVYGPGLEDGIYGVANTALFREGLDFLEAGLPQKGRLLDIGCAGGSS